MTVAVLGSANLDTVLTVHRHPRPGETVLGSASRYEAGGKGLNQAVASAQAGAKTVFVGAVGEDTDGYALADALMEADVDAHLIRSFSRTGTATVVVAEGGENSIIVIPGANGDVEAVTLAADKISGALNTGDVLLTQLEIPIPVVQRSLRRAKSGGATTILNAAPSHTLPTEVLQDVDILIVNEHECLELAGNPTTIEQAAAGLAKYATSIVVTLGRDGVLIVDAKGSRRLPAFRVTAVDTTAAGDTFSGALAARLSQTRDISASIMFGNAAAALSVQKPGASVSAPTLAAILSFLEKHAVSDRAT
uniref:ribokinase n=1 Tax=Paenarthrobacter ureafaciens TaxID=37931 RepID=UPI003F4946B7